LLAEALENRDFSVSEVNNTNASGVSPYLRIKELKKGMNESFVSDMVREKEIERKGNYYKSIVLSMIFFAMGVFIMCSQFI
jgi:hypothetical protein